MIPLPSMLQGQIIVLSSPSDYYFYKDLSFNFLVPPCRFSFKISSHSSILSSHHSSWISPGFSLVSLHVTLPWQHHHNSPCSLFHPASLRPLFPLTSSKPRTCRPASKPETEVNFNSYKSPLCMLFKTYSLTCFLCSSIPPVDPLTCIFLQSSLPQSVWNSHFNSIC